MSHSDKLKKSPAITGDFLDCQKRSPLGGFFGIIWEHNIELAEDFRHSYAGNESYTLRSQTIDLVFADAKENHGLRYTLLRGLNRAKNWVKLKFAALNLKSDTQRVCELLVEVSHSAKLAMWA